MWEELGRLKLHKPDLHFTGASDEQVKILGKFKQPGKTGAASKTKMLEFVVTRHLSAYWP